MVDKREFDQSIKRKERLIAEDDKSSRSHLLVPLSKSSRESSPQPASGSASHSEAGKTAQADGKYALFWRRLVAGLIDGFLLGWLQFFPFAAAAYFAYGVRHFMPDNVAVQLLPHAEGDLGTGWFVIGFILLAWLMITWLYIPYCESSFRHGTIGKRLAGLQVTDLHGQPMAIGDATIRLIVQGLFGILFFCVPIALLLTGVVATRVADIGCIWSPAAVLFTSGMPLFSGYTQTLIDRLFGRKVINRFDGSANFAIDSLEKIFAGLVALSMLGLVLMPVFNLRPHDLQIDSREARWKRNVSGSAFIAQRKILTGEKIVAADLKGVTLPAFQMPIYAIENRNLIENHLAYEHLKSGTVITHYDVLPHSLRLGKILSNRTAPWSDPLIYKSGLHDCEKYIRAHPSKPDGYHGRALLFVIHGDYARALKDCDRAIHIEKHHPDYYLTRARAYIGLHQDAKALKDLSRAIALDDQNSEYRLERAAQLTKERKFKNALEDVSVALEQDEDNCDALRLRAKIYHGMKKLTLAKHDLKRVKEITDALHNGPLD